MNIDTVSVSDTNIYKYEYKDIMLRHMVSPPGPRIIPPDFKFK